MSARITFFFRGDRLVRLDMDTKVVDVVPTVVADLWPALPEGFRGDFDAVVNRGDGHLCFVKGSRYLRFDLANQVVDGGPADVAEAWPGVPKEFAGDIDAAVNWGDGHAFFFAGDRYLRYDLDEKKVDIGPAAVSGGWPALPKEFRHDLDAVVHWGEGHAYFFKGDRYLRFDLEKKVVDVGPASVSGGWPGLPEEFRSGLDAVVNATWTDHWEQVSLDRRILYVMERLVDRYGYPVRGAAGLVGNLVAESGVIPSRVEGSQASTPMRSANFAGVTVDHTADAVRGRNPATRTGPRLPGIGLAQWTYKTRRAGLFAHPFNGSALGAAVVFNMDAQIDYLVRELRAQFGGVQKVLVNRHTTAEAACDEVVYSFEVPGSVLDGGHKLPRSDQRVQKVFAQRRVYATRAVAVYRAAHP
jgi:hypothetical protein